MGNMKNNIAYFKQLTDSTTTYLPCSPDEISDATSSNWSDTSIVGRSSPISAYVGTGYRNVGFSFILHRDMYSDSKKIEDIIIALRRTVYPKYSHPGIVPPITLFRFGKFVVKGIVRSMSFTWKKPLNEEGEYSLCEVSVSIDDIPPQVMDVVSLGVGATSGSMNPFNHSIDPSKLE